MMALFARSGNAGLISAALETQPGVPSGQIQVVGEEEHASFRRLIRRVAQDNTRWRAKQQHA